jgi:sec-independent protein translocase protein TatA
MIIPMLSMLNTPEIILILAFALIFFGAKKLPEMARGLGQGIKEFKKASREVTDELHNAIEAEPPAPPKPAAPKPAESVPQQSAESTPPAAPPKPGAAPSTEMPKV